MDLGTRSLDDPARAALLDTLDMPALRALCGEMGVPVARSRKETIARLLALVPRGDPTRRTFVAIDFETADYQRDSACAVALVRVEDGKVTGRAAHLIRPPRRDFVFTHIHGITWAQVQREPTFAELWPRLRPLLEGAAFLAAHNASFDRSVLGACCTRAALTMPTTPFLCTVKVARTRWSLNPAKLPDVCGHLGIPLRHHDAASDAEACARIVLAAEADVG